MAFVWNATTSSPMNVTETATVDSTDMGYGYLVVGVCVILANAVVLFVVVMSRELHLPPLWIMAYMAFWDFLFGCFILVFYMPAAFLWRFPYPDSFKLVSFSLHVLLLGQTLINIAMAMLDRYIAIGWPMVYSRIVTTKRFVVVIFILLLFGICRVGVFFLTSPTISYNPRVAMSFPETGSTSIINSIRRMAILSVPLITLSTIFFTYFRICVLHRRSRLSMRTTSQTTTFPLMRLISTGVFLLAYVPAFISIIMASTAGERPGLLQWTSIALYSNSLWNVFIYTATYRPFKDALVKVFCPTHHRKQRQKIIVKMMAATRE